MGFAARNPSSALFYAFPDHESGSHAGRATGVRVPQFVSGNRKDTFLIGSNPVRVRAAPNVNDEHMTVLVYVVGAKIGDASLHGRLVFIRRAGIAVIGGEFRHVGAQERKRKPTAPFEHEKTVVD